MSVLVPEGFVTLAEAVHIARGMACDHAFEQLRTRQAAHDSRPVPDRGTAERAAYDEEAALLLEASEEYEFSSYESLDRLKERWEWLRQELFFGNLKASNYGPSGHLEPVLREFWGSKAAEYAYVVGDMSIAGSRHAYGPAFVPVADLESLVESSLSSQLRLRFWPTERSQFKGSGPSTSLISDDLVLTPSGRPKGFELVEVTQQGSPGAPRRYDGEQFLVEAFRILWEDGIPQTQAKLMSLALDAYERKRFKGGVPSDEWAKLRIRKLWVGLKLGNNSD